MAAPSLWTEERKAYLVQAWQAAVPPDEMMVALNLMAGPLFSEHKQISEEARRRKIKRPDWYKLQLRLEHCKRPKKPKPMKVKKPKRILWTSERIDLLTSLWPTTTPNSDILAKLNDLPGEKFSSRKQISAKADLLVIRRPDGFFKQSALWSEERDSVLRIRYQTSSSNEEIIKELNTYSGTPIARTQQLADRAKILGVRRPREYIALLAAAARQQQAKVAKPVDRKPPRMPLPRRLPEPAKRSPKSPIKVPWHTLYNQGFQLWQDGYLKVDKRDDLDAINKAIRRAQPGHPGFQIATRYWGR